MKPTVASKKLRVNSIGRRGTYYVNSMSEPPCDDDDPMNYDYPGSDKEKPKTKIDHKAKYEKHREKILKRARDNYAKKKRPKNG